MNPKKKIPFILLFVQPTKFDETIYDYTEPYNHKTQKLEYGKFFAGSPKVNTRCNKFSLIGSDKTMADDTKEKKR
jgi:hypothetical protein